MRNNWLPRVWPLWSIYAFIGISYLISYLVHTSGPGGFASLGAVFTLTGKMIGTTFLPWSFGGPWAAAEPDVDAQLEILGRGRHSADSFVAAMSAFESARLETHRGWIER